MLGIGPSVIGSPLLWHPSLRTADVFPVVASLPPKIKRSDDRKYVYGLQASGTPAY